MSTTDVQTTGWRAFFGSSKGGIVFILVGMFAISINDVLIKRLSGDYPLHQMVMVRSAIGLCFSMVFVHFEGGLSILRPRRPVLQLIRALMIVFANLVYFMALAVIPLADATALFFVAPLFITLLSIPFLGEKVGARRIGAVVVGFLGVLIIVRPGSASDLDVPFWVMTLPIAAALGYAFMQILTRKLGASSKASAMAVYIQVTFVLVGLGFFLVAGDGRYAENTTNESLIFLLRAWVWPAPEDLWAFAILGVLSSVVGYALSQAYRLGDAATIAAYEYTAMPLAVFWGWIVFGALPGMNTAFGIALIMGAGIYVFIRENARQAKVAGSRPVRR